MKTVKVTLNDQEFEIVELRSRANAAWRKSLQGPFDELAQTLEGAPEIDLTDGAGIADLIQKASGLAIGSVDILVRLLLEYAPQLEEAAAEAYDSELIGAFVAVLGLAFPFGSVISKIQTTLPAASPGPEQEQTKQS